MKAITKNRFKIPLRFIAPNIREVCERKAYFSRNYKKVFNDTLWIYSRFTELCSTYLVDDDNIAIFNRKKTAIAFYAGHVLRKLDVLEKEINKDGMMNCKIRKMRESIISMAGEIISMCG